MKSDPSNEQPELAHLNRGVGLIIVSVVLLLTVLIVLIFDSSSPENKPEFNIAPTDNDMPSSFWQPVKLSQIKDDKKYQQILYGHDLIVKTAEFLGPKGAVDRISNGLNCQNCHLDGGTKVFGNNYGSVASMYPKFRARSGSIEDLPKRINDCFERSLNGKALKVSSPEMQAMVAYIQYIGSNVAKGSVAKGSGLKELQLLSRAANPKAGETIYEAKCASCHQSNGQGIKNGFGDAYLYPPLWGEHSFNDAAGLHRLTNMAKFVKYNMPLGADHENPQLSDEEAWDVSAFIISQKRPHLETPKDWPDISKKPMDHPFGPYADQFSETQHKYGPFTAMVKKKA